MNMRHRFQSEQWLPYSLDSVFLFFTNPKNLPTLMECWQHARIEALHLVAPTEQAIDDVAGAGSRIVLSFRPVRALPVRVRWEAEIVEFAWNEGFCDRQLRGPFAFWRHCHRVRPEQRNGTEGTLLSDVIEYELPPYVPARYGQWMAARQMEKAFRTRHEETAKALAASVNDRSD